MTVLTSPMRCFCYWHNVLYVWVLWFIDGSRYLCRQTCPWVSNQPDYVLIYIMYFRYMTQHLFGPCEVAVLVDCHIMAVSSCRLLNVTFHTKWPSRSNATDCGDGSFNTLFCKYNLHNVLEIFDSALLLLQCPGQRHHLQNDGFVFGTMSTRPGCSVSYMKVVIFV